MTTIAYSPSEKQINFLDKLYAERDHNVPAYDISTLDRRAASKLIDALMGCPVKQRTADTEADSVPAGRFAVTIDGTLGFYKVDAPTEGKWAGWVFVKQQAGDDYYPVKGARRSQVIKAIEADPKAAMLLYGRELGSCGHCGRTLTDEASREAGIGPVCATKMDW